MDAHYLKHIAKELRYHAKYRSNKTEIENLLFMADKLEGMKETVFASWLRKKEALKRE